MLDAWDAGNRKAFAARFSDDALFIGFDGSVMRGHRIERVYHGGRSATKETPTKGRRDAR